jgi:predicted site-specific integrase-resolvase
MEKELSLDLLRDSRPMLKPAEAAEYLQVSPKTLALWRSTGDGPPFVCLGRSVVRYRVEDLRAHVEGRVARSIADADRKRR